MIKGYCRTNLDGYGTEIWPKSFVEVPKMGHRVKARSGRSLKVVGITHQQLTEDTTPYISIELNKK